MKRVAEFLIRLYPARWRARYGEEFEALLEDSPASVASVFDLLKGVVKMRLAVPSFPKLALALSSAGLLAGFGLSFLMTPQYISTATMNAEGEDAGIEVMAAQNEIPSRTSLSNIIQDPRLNLYREERAKLPLEDVIEKMRRQDLHIRILERPAGTSGRYDAFTISFAYGDPYKAQRVVQLLINDFNDANVNRQHDRHDRLARIASFQKSAGGTDPLEERISAIEKRLGITPPTSAPVPFVDDIRNGLIMEVIDPPNLPFTPVSPNRAVCAATGFGSGFAAAVVIAIFRRRPPPLPFPAQTA
jgi:hypothetical protein